MHEKLANKLRIARVTKGFSQEVVAFELGISQVAYSKFENGQTKATLQRLKEVSKILEVSFLYLLNDEND